MNQNSLEHTSSVRRSCTARSLDLRVPGQPTETIGAEQNDVRDEFVFASASSLERKRISPSRCFRLDLKFLILNLTSPFARDRRSGPAHARTHSASSGTPGLYHTANSDRTSLSEGLASHIAQTLAHITGCGRAHGVGLYKLFEGSVRIFMATI